MARRRVEPLILPLKSVAYAFGTFSGLKASAKSRGNLVNEIQTDNEYEKQLLSNVIPPEQIGITFGDIGALGKVKNTLFELVILPLVRPELFVRGNLTKPLKGIEI
jgi:SpoVK/Ycf46/Vps4 family AAA+-type ATPase